MTDRKLTRSRKHRVIAGVCGGIAEYFEVDATVVRLVTLAASVFSAGIVLGAYIVAWLILPDADSGESGADTLYDRYGDGSLCTTKGIGAFWALQADALDKGRMDRMVAHLADTAEFDRPHRVPSLSADHPKYNPTGRYWQGGVWPGANYMVIDGLYRKGYHDLALEVAENHFNAVFEVWKNTGTFWEYYAPEKIEPGFMARKDFVGWAGLPPIAVFIEYILGIKSDYSEGRIVWDINHTEAHGIDRYPYGPEGVVGLKVKGRNSAGDVPAVSVTTNVPFDLTVTWGDGQSRTVRVEKSGSVKLN